MKSIRVSIDFDVEYDDIEPGANNKCCTKQKKIVLPNVRRLMRSSANMALFAFS